MNAFFCRDREICFYLIKSFVESIIDFIFWFFCSHFFYCVCCSLICFDMKHDSTKLHLEIIQYHRKENACMLHCNHWLEMVSVKLSSFYHLHVLCILFVSSKLFELIGVCARNILRERKSTRNNSTATSIQISIINHQFINGNKNCWNKQPITIRYCEIAASLNRQKP